MRVWALGILLAALGAGCSGSEVAGTSQSSGLVACDPLAAETPAIQLGRIIAAGQSADGIIYVIDRDDHDDHDELRAFASEDGQLRRLHVNGSGEINDAGGSAVVLNVGSLDPGFTLEVTTDAAGAIRMGIFNGFPPSKTFDIGREGEELALLSADAVQSMPVSSYTNDIVIEYAATLDDGRALLVLRPDDFDDYTEFRVFFGSPDHLDEQKLRGISRARDGGSTTLDFDVDGKPAHASFIVSGFGTTEVATTPSLSLDARDVGLSLGPPESPAEASYFCQD